MFPCTAQEDSSSTFFFLSLKHFIVFFFFVVLQFACRECNVLPSFLCMPPFTRASDNV